jgi:hypothetical protein
MECGGVQHGEVPFCEAPFTEGSMNARLLEESDTGLGLGLKVYVQFLELRLGDRIVKIAG